MRTLEHLSISSIFSLPLELIDEVVKHLPLSDQQSLSLTCQLGRKLTLRFIFGHLQLRSYARICNFHLARHDVKAVVKKLELRTYYYARSKGEDISIIFQFLETLPNLQSFKLIQFDHLIAPADLSKLIASLRHAPLREFGLHTGKSTVMNWSPIIGPSHLEKISLRWNIVDPANQPGSANIHLYELIRPSLKTLVDLHINYPINNDTPFDLQLLKPAGNTLRSFRYILPRHDEGILDTIPTIFPYLTKLSLYWSITRAGRRHSILWKNAHIKCLARIQNLVDLTLSSDFEVEARDVMLERTRDNYSWYVRSYKRRLEKTLEVASACKKLQRCTWIQIPYPRPSSLVHSFIIGGRQSYSKNNLTPWIVRGLKQDWMGRDYLQLDGSIVKCKLEDLPGNIIGKNDVSNSVLI